MTTVDKYDKYLRTDNPETGVISSCHRGNQIGEEVQQLANRHGWRYSSQFEMVMKDDDTIDARAYTWAWDEAEEYLNKHVAKDNHYYGSQPMAGCGCWGYWEIIEVHECPEFVSQCCGANQHEYAEGFCAQCKDGTGFECIECGKLKDD